MVYVINEFSVFGKPPIVKLIEKHKEKKAKEAEAKKPKKKKYGIIPKKDYDKAFKIVKSTIGVFSEFKGMLTMHDDAYDKYLNNTEDKIRVGEISVDVYMDMYESSDTEEETAKRNKYEKAYDAAEKMIRSKFKKEFGENIDVNIYDIMDKICIDIQSRYPAESKGD